MQVDVFQVGRSKVLDIVEFQDTPAIAARRSALYDVPNKFDEVSSSYEVVSPSDGGTHHQISLEAIASYSALLGNGNDYEKTVREIMFIREHGEPDPDPETFANAWTSAYEELESIADGTPMPMSFGDELTGVGKTRSMLGLPSNDGGQVMSDDVTGIQSYELSDEVSSVIDSFADEISTLKEKFLDDLRSKGEQLTYGMGHSDDLGATQSS